MSTFLNIAVASPFRKRDIHLVRRSPITRKIVANRRADRPQLVQTVLLRKQPE